MEAHRNSNIRDLNIELTRVETLLRDERRRAEEIDLLRKVGLQQRWLPTSLDDLDLAQLGALKESLIGFKKDLDGKLQKEMFRVSNSQHCHSDFLEFDHLLPYSNGYCYGWSGGMFDGSNGASSSTLPNDPRSNMFQMF